MKVSKILCPVDFSAGSRQAMHWAIKLAGESGAELVLLHAWQLPVAIGDFAFAPNVAVDVEAAARECMDKELADARSLGATRVSAKLVSGAPWIKIVDELADRSFDLVVMGTHGRTAIKRFLLGSVAEKVVRHAPCPVLTVRPDVEARSFQSILVPVDFSDSSRDAMNAAAALARPGGRGITLLHVVELPTDARGEPQIEVLLEVMVKQAAEHLERWAAELRAKTGVPVQTRSRLGRAGGDVLAVLEEAPGFDLVVTGSHGRTGIPRVLLGSVAERIVRHAPCPVMVIRQRSAS